MPVTRLINLNANNGAWTAVAATITARQVQMIEDGSVSAQGLEVQYPGDGYATTSTVPYGQQPLAVTGAGHDGAAGLPAQNQSGDFNYRPADVYCQLRSATATPTTVRVVEMEA